MAVHMGERFKHIPVQAEITRLIRKDPKEVIEVAEALHFLLGDKLEAASKPALRVRPLRFTAFVDDTLMSNVSGSPSGPLLRL